MSQSSMTVTDLEDLMRTLTKLWIDGEIDMNADVRLNGHRVWSIQWDGFNNEIRLETLG